MSKIGLIIKREYSTRVKKKTFIIMTILGPILFAALMIAPALLMQLEDDEFKKIAVIDETGVFSESLISTKHIEFYDFSAKYLNQETFEYDLTKATDDLKDSDYYALLYIPSNAVFNAKGSVILYSYKQPNIGIKMHIAHGLEKKVKDIKFQVTADDLDINQEQISEILRVANSEIQVVTNIIDDKGEIKESHSEVAMIVGYISGFLIYMFVFMYGSQVMRGVIEEKTSRIVEVIVSSVKPFQLMMGKIIGVALVGITQFALWVVLTIGLVSIGQAIILKDFDPAKLNPNTTEIGSELSPNSLIPDEKAIEFEKIFQAVYSINYFVIIASFLFYFIGGYLLYGALFAMIGSAVDNEADTQQFMLPITLPMVLGLFVMLTAMQNPNGSLAYWFSIIPFTSPIVMMSRIPYGVPYIDLFISMALLVATFIFTTWFAGKVYRVGILMYGKKVNYKELWKWFRYKN
ncbi:MAG: ABC transporter permease [Bacteroidales bacterium]|nr:ABC transporter permease [Bacteroidales bacterium]MCK9498771.1 ABC transporter permease [Bacteroidales bacterium]MDY0314309.1 ABC transporter permease [Bacteroidales bacterium]